ncbi:hypothetical protein U4E84_13380 [Halorubrum sp. AD140]|nr:hypothetical protein [Halorubrum sp. AD140]
MRGWFGRGRSLSADPIRVPPRQEGDRDLTGRGSGTAVATLASPRAGGTAYESAAAARSA